MNVPTATISRGAPRQPVQARAGAVGAGARASARAVVARRVSVCAVRSAVLGTTTFTWFRPATYTAGTPQTRSVRPQLGQGWSRDAAAIPS
ncbi:hypothetical protein [Wenjunlia tyrosinilytica]|uniref:hypothetical protein n=1 Tax=Wenjunlia tyrosinilytica TaxID=1544741 RepID=UPI00166996A4|nr:hypothetical protein [Wenjunlia tyrosinilytica]